MIVKYKQYNLKHRYLDSNSNTMNENFFRKRFIVLRLGNRRKFLKNNIATALLGVAWKKPKF